MSLKNLKILLGRIENIVEGKEKMLLTSILSFIHNVFTSSLSQGHEKSGFCCKELF